MAAGGIAVFPADTVYGLACDPSNRLAVERLYLLKRRSLAKPSAVMFFDAGLALASLPELGGRTFEALSRLLPGGVTALLANPAGPFPARVRGGSSDARAAGPGRGAARRGSLAGASDERQPGGRR